MCSVWRTAGSARRRVIARFAACGQHVHHKGTSGGRGLGAARITWPAPVMHRLSALTLQVIHQALQAGRQVRVAPQGFPHPLAGVHHRGVVAAAELLADPRQ